MYIFHGNFSISTIWTQNNSRVENSNQHLDDTIEPIAKTKTMPAQNWIEVEALWWLQNKSKHFKNSNRKSIRNRSRYSFRFDLQKIGIQLIGQWCSKSNFSDFYIAIHSYVPVKFCLSFASFDCVRPVCPSISPIPKPINMKGNQWTSE